MYRNQALELYMTAFPDDPIAFATDFINRYFDSCCRYAVKDGKIVSMLFLLDASFKNKEKLLPAAYLYAAATLPEYRGQGLMTELIEKAKQETAEKGKILVTKPATESLYGYYGKFGFKTVCYTAGSVSADILQTASMVSKEEYARIRENFLKNTPHILLSDINYALAGLILFGGENFCAAADVEEKGITIKEYICEGTDPLNGDIPFAMAVPCAHLPERIYFGIAMD